MGKFVRTDAGAVDVGAGTTGRTTPDLPNTGLSILTATTAADEYVLAAPFAGAFKTIVSVSGTSSAGPTIWASTGTAIKINGFSSASAANTKFVFGATTSAEVVQLVGINSTSWAVVSAWPVHSSGPGATGGTS